MAKPQILVDGDPIVYRAGFASQTRNIHCIVESDSGQIDQIKFPSKTDRNKWAGENPAWAVISEEEEVIAEPIENALAGTKYMLRGIVDEVGSDDLHVVLSEASGKGNFRHAIAKQAQYKGNRKAPRPFHYQNIRDYLVNHWGAQIVSSREADDELAIRAKRYRASGIPHVIASIDKDLDQIPGRHYDYAKKVSYDVSEEDARRAFWIQALAGDRTDNIPGCWRVGGDRAPKIVDEWLSNGFDDKQMFAALVAEYEKSKRFSTCPYRASPSVEVALETSQLVWMQDEPCTVWAPAGVPRGKIPCELDD